MEKPHKRLIAWQTCMDLVVLIYKMTNQFPKEEKFGLISQMRRAVSGRQISQRVPPIDHRISSEIF
jgi:hypothetical protein